MYSTDYANSFSPYMSSSISRNVEVHANEQRIHHPQPKIPTYAVDAYVQGDAAPMTYRDTVTRQLLGSKYDDYMLNIYDNRPESIGADIHELDMFQSINESPEVAHPDDAQMNYNMMIMNQPQSTNVSGRIEDYPRFKQVRPLIDDFTDDLKYDSVRMTANAKAKTAIKANQQLMKNKVVIQDNLESQKPRKTDIDELDMVISDPTVDYTLFKPVNERFGPTMTLNKSVPIQFQESTPTTCRTDSCEAFKTNLREYFSREAFEPTSTSNAYTSPLRVEPFTYKTPAETAAAPIAIESYLDTLKARASAVCFYLQTNKSYRKWKENWDFLYDNLHKKNKLLFKRLDESDADIAYVVNKGNEVKFRIRDEKRFVPINVYQYVLYHEMAHMSTTELQHTKFFFELLSIIALAALEMGLIDLSRLSSTYYRTNGQPILCKVSMKTELSNGCDLLIEANPNSKDYFNGLKKYIKSK